MLYASLTSCTSSFSLLPHICRHQMFLNVAASSRPKVQIKNTQKLNINLSFVAYFETGSVLTV